MFEIIRNHQLNIMLFLCGACGAFTVLLFITRFLSKIRKRNLVIMELIAVMLLWFDRQAYIYSGNTGFIGYVMVRLSNFFVFFLTSGIVLGFNMYLKELLMDEGDNNYRSFRISIVQVVSIAGMILAIISAFTGLYYHFDENNIYHRGQGFLIAYIIPVICPLIQYTVIRQNKKKFSKLIYISLVLYIFVPIICGIIQIFAYGISIVNMAMVLVSISLYLFTYLDINNEVERVHKLEMEGMQKEQESAKRLFDQTATAFVTAVEKKDNYLEGHAVRVASYAKRIAKLSGKNEEESDRVYYAALLHDVGLIGIPDEVIKNEADPNKWDYEMMRKKPIIGKEILSSVTEYPYLSECAYYSHERFNGTGYPEGLKNEEIPEIARIIAVADAYVTMTTKKRYRDARPVFVAREALVKGSGVEFDPQFADCMVKIIDLDSRNEIKEAVAAIDSGLICNEYRDNITNGIRVEDTIVKITFDFSKAEDLSDVFSAPSIILFDSTNRRVHDNEKAIKEYQYQEFGEIWFDNHSIITEAREIKENIITDEKGNNEQKYEIIAGRYEDHIKLIMKSPNNAKEVIVALPGGSKDTYIGLTGEHGVLSNISIEQTEEKTNADSIPRIVDEISYIDRMESDIKNIQIDRTRSASTIGIKIKNRMKLSFHTMSLPGSSLIWHCPYIVLFYADDKCVGGDNYREYSLIKLNGENEINDEFAINKFTMKKKDDFAGWEAWKTANKEGMECQVIFERKGNKIVTTTENMGIQIENITEVNEDMGEIYVSLTGDQCALTDIRIKYS
ncbi:MAG: HD domain-containing protein [Lachnospiraceae bacterium]|nr:HD domain-containing protein [Lachnospiraceae bacterium]